MGLFTEAEQRVTKSIPMAIRRVNPTCEERLARDFLLIFRDTDLLASGELIVEII